ncbi:uncharacterized protein A4U43_C04F14510 [Asparagus officinalis]|uniref:Uncharacterized protein n=1 Tax=Asparagus officinalis TaxID=4686 RepID=A0A5P1F676_ASPOF|nr:uncharacterized protein A4U43_C04F14510 [Asparagus officinalis]
MKRRCTRNGMALTRILSLAFDRFGSKLNLAGWIGLAGVGRPNPSGSSWKKSFQNGGGIGGGNGGIGGNVGGTGEEMGFIGCTLHSIGLVDLVRAKSEEGFGSGLVGRRFGSDEAEVYRNGMALTRILSLAFDRFGSKLNLAGWIGLAGVGRPTRVDRVGRSRRRLMSRWWRRRRRNLHRLGMVLGFGSSSIDRSRLVRMGRVFWVRT